MVTQRFEFSATPGLTFTAVKLFLRGTDTVAATGAPTAKINNPSRYYIDFTDVPAGTYIMDGFVGAVGGFVAETYEVLLATGLYVPNSELAARIVIGAGTILDSSPVTASGTLRPIVIGDDYLSANDRAFTWTVDAVTGFTAASVVAVLGAEAVLPCGTYSFSVTGTVSDNGDGTWNVSIDLPSADTADLVPGLYDWSLTLQFGGVNITKQLNLTEQTRVRLVKSTS